MNLLVSLCEGLEYLGGQRDVPPRFLERLPAWCLRGFVWGLSIVLILVFGNQSSRFLYIDF